MIELNLFKKMFVFLIPHVNCIIFHKFQFSFHVLNAVIYMH